MSWLRAELYVGREQTYVKHFVLQKYLEKLAYKIGMSWNGATLNYIDGFAGPWMSRDESLGDTSPHIAVRVLQGVADEMKKLGKPPLAVRAMFVERDAEKYRALRASFPDPGASVVKHGEFEQLITEAVAFAAAGVRPFSFAFIDPCGWTGYGLDAISPLLRVEPGEVLINFMTNRINEFIDDRRPQTAATFVDLYGSTDFRDRLVGLQGLDRQEEMVSAYCGRVMERGMFDHAASAVIISPLLDRAHYHLVYASRNDEGLRTFREAERSAIAEQQGMRAGAQKRTRKARAGGQEELFGADALATPYVDELRTRYRARARDTVTRMLTDRGVVPFDELATAAMLIPMTAEQDVRDYLVAEAERGSVAFEGLVGKQRTPLWRKQHRVRLLRRP